jgi:hypothetical protein
MMFVLLPPERLINGVWAEQIGETEFSGTVPPSSSVQVIAGPPGEDGLNGDGAATFVHIQTEPSSEWIINHNLSKFVDVIVADMADNDIGADIRRQSNDQLRILFASPFVGKVYVR